MGAPYFPPPRPSSPYRAADEPAPAPAAPPARAPVVVKRPEPPPESAKPVAPAVKGERPKLTPDEVRALLAVSETLRPKPWGRVAWRGGVIMVPTGAISFLLNFVLGKYSAVFVLLLVLVALAWVARPLYAKDRADWG